MVGNGQIGQQPTATNAALPSSTVLAVKESAQPSSSDSTGSGESQNSGGSGSGNGAGHLSLTLSTLTLGVFGAVFGAMML